MRRIFAGPANRLLIHFSQREINIKPINIGLFAVLLFVFFAAACSPRAAAQTPTEKITVAPAPSQTNTPVPTTVGTSYPAAVILPSIKRLSPSSFTIDGVTFEATAFVRMSCLKFTIQITSDDPIPSPTQDPTFEPVVGLEFYSSPTGAPLGLSLEGRGGGGGTGGPPGAWYQMSQDFLYDVKSPLPIGDIVAMVTFHRLLGISGPARFDVQPVLRPNLQCPQLPPTTPEG